MPVQLNHTIVWCHDKKQSSAFLVRILGCSPAVPFYHFLVVQLANNVSLDFMEKSGPISVQHYAFLIEESEIDATFSRISRCRFGRRASQAREPDSPPLP
jgi:hypothetical protein